MLNCPWMVYIVTSFIIAILNCPLRVYVVTSLVNATYILRSDPRGASIQPHHILSASGLSADNVSDLGSLAPSRDSLQVSVAVR